MSSDSSDHSSPKPSKRKRVIISDSDSSDGSIVIRTHRRRRVYRVTSDSESSEEDSDVPKPVIRRKNYRVVSEDDASYESSETEVDGSNAAAISGSETSASDSGSDWRSGEESAMDEDEGDGEGAARKQKLSKGRKKSKSKVEEGGGEPGRTASMDGDSESSDGQADKCPICLLSFKKQQIATPESCDHSFCLDCLLEWSKNINTCPVDRQTFSMILVKKKFGGKVIKQLPVTIRPPVEEPIQEDATFCEICQECDREDRMLLCDGCDLGYHLECLTPPMTEVPMDEWFCPDCARNSQNDAEVVEIDLDELPDLMEEARRLGESYGRTRTGRERDAGLVARVIPRTRQTERVRANIRADRDRNRAVILSRDSVQTESVSYYDPDQPSTSSSGLDSVLGNAARASEITRRRPRAAAVDKAPKATKRKRKSKKRRTTSGRSGETRVREVRITEINDEGEEEEFVTYVKVKDKSSNPRGTTGRRKTKRRKTRGTRKKGGKKRRARTVRSQAAKVATVKKRLAMALGMHKPNRNDLLLIPNVKNRPTVSDRAVLSSSRHHAGISQVSLFGNSHDLNYSPTGSDSESDGCTSYGGGGSGLLVSSRPRNAIASTRRHAALKTVQNPLLEEERAQSPHANATDLISSILNSQEFWHSKKNSDITLKADGTFFSIKNNNNNNEENKHSINNNQSPIKENKKIEKINQEEETNIPTNETRLDLNNVGQNDLVQNPMYNSPRGGGNRGNFRGGGGGGNNYNCENNRHSYGGGGQYGGGRDSYGQGRHSYGGPRDFNSGGGRDFGPPMNFNQGFEMRGFGANTPPFRNRNPQQQNFRNERPPNRYPPPLLHSFNSQGPEGNNQPPFSPPQQNFQRFRPQLIPPLLSTPIRIPMRPNQQSFHDDLSFPPPGHSDSGMQRNHEDEECDLYSDIENPVAKTVEDSPSPQDQQEAGVLLPPPPEPPSGLLDFEESKSDRDCNDSDQELVIDDTPKEDGRKDGEKYDPFDNDSDSNERPAATQQPPTQDFPLDFEPEMPQGLRLTAYDDDEDEDSQADCPNFSIYSSQTMDVARNSEQELSQQIGPLEPPPMPPDIPNDDDDIIVGDVQACDLADIPEPSDPYVESLQKERRTLSKIPPKKISSNDSRGKITFKIGNKLKLSNKLSNLYDELDENIENSIQQEKEVEEKKSKEVEEKKSKEMEEKKSKEIEEKKSKEVKEDPAPVLEAEKSDEEEEEDEKLEELEKQLKEKEQKLREMEQQEELDKLIEGETEAKSKEIGQKEESATEEEKEEENDEPKKDKPVSTIDLTEKSSDSIISIADSVHSSPKTPAEKESADVSLESEEQEVGGWKEVDMGGEKTKEPETATEVLYDKADEEFISRERDDDEDSKKSSKTPDLEDENDSVVKESEELLEEVPSPSDKTEIETFPLEKDPTEIFDGAAAGDNVNSHNWDSDGAYTPCKDELPVAKVARDSISPFESGLEPITPTKDKSNDDLDGCRTPAGYAGLGTEAISETDEPMSFEDELALLSLRREKEIEEGEIMEEHRLTKSDKAKAKEDEDKNRKKKKDKKEKGKESDKNKENISSQNQVAWKKISKSTKERQYRDKGRRSKSREKDKDKEKEKEKDRDRDRDRDKSKKKNSKDTASRKKEKRKELERYDVRKIVADKPSRPRKDEYGRDIRDESKSRSRSVSRRRSLSRDRRSRSFSRNRQSRTRSRSRLRRSWSRGRRSYSKGARSVSRRKSLSRSRRKLSRRRSASRKKSVSRKRSPSKRRSRSPSVSRKRRSRGRSLSKNRRSRSRTRDNKKKEKITKKHKSRSRSRNRKRSRSKTPKRISSRSRDKKHTKRKRVSRSRERSRSREPRERTKNWEPVSEKPAVERERRSWSAQWTPSWSRSRSRTPSLPRREEVVGWSPPPVLDTVSVPPKNLTVILTNKEAIKKKKKERKKEPKKSKDTERRKKSKRNRTPPPSKEVFASGDNILVSVCFNKENETNAELPEAPEATPLVTPTTKRLRRRENVQQTIEQPVLKRSKKDKTVKESKRTKLSPKNKKEKKKKSKAAEIAATKKPVAVIDLDQSPFREQTPSPRDVIVLSDDDDQKQPEELATPEQHVSPRASPIQHEQFVSQGPKTPPEPQIKFSINKQQSNLRASMINPLHEEEEEIDERADEELEMRAQEELELRLKIGPNTPPEPPTSPPTSPDAYDPFDPTKSRSPTPAASQEATPADERDNSPRNRGEGGDELGMDLEEGDKSLSQEQQSQDNVKGGLVEKPKIISMVTIKRASPNKEEANVAGEAQETSQANESPNKNQGQQNQSQGNFGNIINPVLATVTAAVQRSGAVFNTGTPIGGQRNLLQANRISPINQNKQRSIDRPHLPNLFANPVKPGAGRGSKSSSAQGKNPASAMGQNGSDTGMEAAIDTLDMSSPYSPGSSLSDGIFDPPSPGGHSPQQMPSQNANKSITPSKNPSGGGAGVGKTMDKKDPFESLFGTSPAVKGMGKNRQRKIPEKDKRKKSTNPKVGVRMDENQLQILDDLPSSAVEMQVKDKFLKKLNRQERVVEEVKLVLKPHYTKKHVTKEEYKDIMRKAVPKICHNKTGEINPKKIGQLVEAYVKKCRMNKKKGGIGLMAAKGLPKASKNMWS